MELHGHLGYPLGKTLPSAHVDGDTGPAPVVDTELHGHVGLGRAVGVDPVLLSIAGDLFAPNPAPLVLAAHDLVVDLLGRQDLHGPQGLDLLVTDAGGVEGGGRLHERHGQHLHDVVLHDVAQRTRLLVEAASVLDSQ